MTGLASAEGERSKPSPEGRDDARAREPDSRAVLVTAPAPAGRGAKPDDCHVPRARNEAEA